VSLNDQRKAHIKRNKIVTISNKITLEETIKVAFTRVLNFFLDFNAYIEQANVPNNNIKDIMPNIPCSIELYGLPKKSENKKTTNEILVNKSSLIHKCPLILDK
jgi:hypothetical protein